ncbi:hypothetical protein BC941DRAFT_346042 [Chlamydoabsidia padenii]|nr:hypothetical protein BC941DRAFT_346042 [Chlamydoabsidia padenii]
MLRTKLPVRCLQGIITTRTCTFIRHRSTGAKAINASKPGKLKSSPKPVSALIIDPENKLPPLEKLASVATNNGKLLIGDYVEVFKNGGHYSGMIVQQKTIGGQQQRLTVVIRNGKTIECRTADVAFYLPDFASSPAVTRFLRAPVKFDRESSTMDHIPTEYMRAIQTFQSTVKLEKGMALRQLDSMYLHFITRSSSDNSVSLDELTQYVFDTTQPSAMNRHATFLYLVANNIHFVPDANTLRTNLWYLRPERQVDLISNIIHWIRTRDPHFTGFLERANMLVDFYKTHADEQLGTMPHDAITQIKNKVQLTETDKMFVNFMADWIKMPKVIMDSPHELFCPAILKGLQCYDSLFIDQSLAITFLKQIGMFRPWDNVGLVEDAALARPFLWSKDAQKYDSIMDGYTKMFINDDQHQWKKAGFYATDPSDSIRHDFGDLPVYTIDDPSAKEIDDGVSVEHIPGSKNSKDKTWLHIHIADPTAYVPPTHTLASIMADRLQTLYLPERHYPMLPNELSAYTFSLGSSAKIVRNGSQYAFTFSVMLDDQGQFLDWKVRPSLVRNVVKLYYDDLDAFFVSKMGDSLITSPDPLFDINRSYSHPQQQQQQQQAESTLHNLTQKTQDDLLDLYHLTMQHSQQRVRNGAINFMRPSPTITLTPSPLDLPPMTFDNGLQYTSDLPAIDLTLDRSGISPSRKLVAEMMVMGGRIVSQYARDNGVVLPFRRQKWQPSQLAAKEAIMENRDPVTGTLPFQELLRHIYTLPSAELTTTSGEPHALMGITDGYCKATSPLRRYMDMIIHWQLKAHLLGEKPPFDVDALNTLGPRIERREKQMSRLQSRSLQFWVLSLMQRLEHDKDMTWRCMVNEESKQATTQLGGYMRAASATILDLGIRGRIEHLKDSVHVGDVLNVRISSIDPRLGMVNMVVV